MIIWAIIGAYDTLAAQIVPHWKLPSISQAFGGWPSEWWLVGGLALLVLFILEGSYRTITKIRTEHSKEINTLKQAKPLLVIKPINNKLTRQMCLEVTNNGASGDIEAQIVIVQEQGHYPTIRPPNSPYQGYWQLSGESKTSLPQGHTDILEIGQLQSDMSTRVAHFTMVFYESSPLGAGKRAYDSDNWIIGLGDPIPVRFIIQVTISSTPNPLNGPIIKTYLVDGGVGVDQDILKEQPTSAHLGDKSLVFEAFR
jgi:hypothetical protein